MAETTIVDSLRYEAAARGENHALMRAAASYIDDLEARCRSLDAGALPRRQRIAELEGALRAARPWVREIEMATVDEPVGIMGNKAAHVRNIIDRALGESS